MRRKPLRVGIVGAGRVGAALGAGLAAAGHQIVAVSGDSVASRRRIARLLPSAEVLPPDQVAARAEFLILSVPDDALGRVATGAFSPGQIVAHTSGAHGLGVLAPAVVAGARPLALHPAMTFTGTRVDLKRLRDGVSFGVTAPPDLRPFATRVVADLGGTIEWIPEERRALYHAALAHGANHLVTLVAEAADLLREAGVGNPNRMLGPLLSAALDNALRHGDRALTGPVARGDVGTVRAHLRVLAEHAPEMLPTYRALAARTAERAEDSGLLRPDLAPDVFAVLKPGEDRR